MPTTDDFYLIQKDKSKIKTLIVTDFLKAYFPIIENSVGKKADIIYYIDLFSGPGKYENGDKSTPLILLDLINEFKSNYIREKTQLVFNDIDSGFCSQLMGNILNHDVYGKLAHRPLVLNQPASEVDLKQFTSKKVPIFSFINPWGYKGVSSEQIWTLIENIGSDCVLFFNSNRILMDINKADHLDDFTLLFGDKLSDAKQIALNQNLTEYKKADKFLEFFSENLVNRMKDSKFPDYKLFVLPFYVEADYKEKISHQIVFITKSHKAVLEMKRVMVSHSNSIGLKFTYDNKDKSQMALFGREANMNDEIQHDINAIVRKYPIVISKVWNISSLLMMIDNYKMKNEFQVSPYLLEDRGR